MTKPAKTRSEGQWALGEREPLNANEEFKRHARAQHRPPRPRLDGAVHGQCHCRRRCG